MDCNRLRPPEPLRRECHPFSPLILGEWIATQTDRNVLEPQIGPFSPLILGEWIATGLIPSDGIDLDDGFQSPNPRGMDCNRGSSPASPGASRLSVP